ncbi:pyridoxamine 5'-phosphate oxidase family protein [Thermincola potens]|uniref:Pyridoxamine 5'-phosphate oxidase-related FMN-binding protein n=1 Tax=Thermincola potens (strain JR) TaxID=635013 RepID=D5XEW6_THEPJ|nr:pyridoxamine 5'-phosphate oxidase family protein [Thermincola potens]ADG82187.1 pyridoxamine 5'-phosphate oxidase-related FMN-binding protein [Thermincola potens JR]
MSKIIGDSLPPELFELFKQEATTVIVSTISEDGYPHALPVHLLTAKDNKTVRMALMKGHQTTQNIKINGKAFITVLEGPDIALGIKGTARVVREPMEGNAAMVMVEFNVEEVKSDTTPTVVVVQGVRTLHRSAKTAQFFRTMFDELKF